MQKESLDTQQFKKFCELFKCYQWFCYVLVKDREDEYPLDDRKHQLAKHIISFVSFVHYELDEVDEVIIKAPGNILELFAKELVNENRKIQSTLKENSSYQLGLSIFSKRGIKPNFPDTEIILSNYCKSKDEYVSLLYNAYIVESLYVFYSIEDHNRYVKPQKASIEAAKKKAEALLIDLKAEPALKYATPKIRSLLEKFIDANILKSIKTHEGKRHNEVPRNNFIRILREIFIDYFNYESAPVYGVPVDLISHLTSYIGEETEVRKVNDVLSRLNL